MGKRRLEKPLDSLLSARVTYRFLVECEKISFSAGFSTLSHYIREAVEEKNQRTQQSKEK